MPFFFHDGLSFHYQCSGQGVPFIFQHGLGGDLSQPFGLFSPPPGIALFSFDFRAHGETCPFGNPARVSFSSFADDVRVFMDEMRLERAVVGGISMGAGVSVNFGLRYPERVLGLVLSRPAWLDGPMERGGEIFSAIARLIKLHGAQKGLAIFLRSESYCAVLRESGDAAASLRRQFESSRAEEVVVRLERMPRDAPNYDKREWKTIRVPTLVLASPQDPIHPHEYGTTLAAHIPGAEFHEITAKSVSVRRHADDTQQYIANFLVRHFPLTQSDARAAVDS